MCCYKKCKKRELIFIFITLSIISFSFSAARAAVWCQGDDIGDDEAKKNSGRASKKVCDAVSNAFQMLGYIETINIDEKALSNALQLKTQIIENLKDAMNYFDKLVGNRKFLTQADMIVKETAHIYLSTGGKYKGTQMGFNLIQGTVKEATNQGSMPIFLRCNQELQNALQATLEFPLENQNRLKAEPEIIWHYVQMWNNLILVGKEFSILFYKN